MRSLPAASPACALMVLLRVPERPSADETAVYHTCTWCLKCTAEGRGLSGLDKHVYDGLIHARMLNAYWHNGWDACQGTSQTSSLPGECCLAIIA